MPPVDLPLLRTIARTYFNAARPTSISPFVSNSATFPNSTSSISSPRLSLGTLTHEKRPPFCLSPVRKRCRAVYKNHVGVLPLESLTEHVVEPINPFHRFPPGAPTVPDL